MNAVRGFRVGLLLLGRSQWEFHEEIHDIKYHQFCWHGKEREGWSFMGCEESFITMKHHHETHLAQLPSFQSW